MKVLLSIKPEYVEQIFNGTKKFEYRRAIFKNKDVKTIIVYSTLPVGKIVGEFDIEEIIEDSPKDIWHRTKKHSGVQKVFYNAYFDGRKRAFAIKIASIKKYKNEICPYTQLDNFTAPQSFMYAREQLLNKIEDVA